MLFWGVPFFLWHTLIDTKVMVTPPLAFNTRLIDSSGPNNLQDLSTSISSRFESNQETLNFAISIVQQIIPSI